MNKTETGADGKKNEETNGKVKIIPTKESKIVSKMSVNAGSYQREENPKQPDEEKELLKELEASSEGKIKGSLVLMYLKSSNKPCTLVFLIISFLLAQILASLADIWVAYW